MCTPSSVAWVLIWKSLILAPPLLRNRFEPGCKLLHMPSVQPSWEELCATCMCSSCIRAQIRLKQTRAVLCCITTWSGTPTLLMETEVDGAVSERSIKDDRLGSTAQHESALLPALGRLQNHNVGGTCGSVLSGHCPLKGFHSTSECRGTLGENHWPQLSNQCALLGHEDCGFESFFGKGSAPTIEILHKIRPCLRRRAFIQSVIEKA